MQCTRRRDTDQQAGRRHYAVIRSEYRGAQPADAFRIVFFLMSTHASPLFPRSCRSVKPSSLRRTGGPTTHNDQSDPAKDRQ